MQIWEMQFYSTYSLMFDPFICDYPEESCSADIHVGNDEISCYMTLPTDQIRGQL